MARARSCGVAWERVDQAIARWGFQRLSGPADLAQSGQGRVALLGRTCADYFTSWAKDHGLNPSEDIRRSRLAAREAACAPRYRALSTELKSS